MLVRQLRRVALDSRLALPPTFLCPWTASLTTEAYTATSSHPPPSLLSSASPAIPPAPETNKTRSRPSTSSASQSSLTAAPAFHDSISTYLPLLQAQKQIYINVHIHAKSYLVTQGDTLRLPFLMHGVQPGDVLRLNRAITLGSRDFTLRAPARQRRGKSGTASSVVVVDPTPAARLTTSGPRMGSAQASATMTDAPAAEGEVFVPHIMAGQIPYLDERLFVCRAVVVGEESEPMRIMEKTKRRQRHVRQVKSKHKYTVLRIKELRVNSLEEVAAVEASAAADKERSKPERAARVATDVGDLSQTVAAAVELEGKERAGKVATTTDVEDLNATVATAVELEGRERAKAA